MKNAFLLFLIAGALELVPLVGALGGIISLVGIIFFILAFRTLGRSSLQGAANYRSTGRWLVWSIIIMIVVTVAGVIVVIALSISSLVSEFTSSTPLPTNPFQLPELVNMIYEMIAVILVAYLIWISAWVKMCFSMQKLSTELSERRIALAGRLYVIQIAFSFAGSALSLTLLFPSIFSTASLPVSTPYSSLYAPFSYLFVGGFWSLLGIVSIAGTLIVLLASYWGYHGVSNALGVLRRAPPPRLPPMPTTAAPPSAEANLPLQQDTKNVLHFCPKCGHGISGHEILFCPNCGNSLGEAHPSAGSVPSPKAGTKRRTKIIILAIVVISLLLASVATYSFVSPRSLDSYPKSGLDLASGPVCYPFDGTVNGSVPKASQIPTYLQQFYLLFNQNLTSVLQYNVSAVQQEESFGNGPMYLLTGLTDTNYLYDVGLSWNMLVTSTLHRSGFGFVYWVRNVAGNRTIFPVNTTSSEGLNFSGSVKEGDTVLLSLKIFPANSNGSLRDMVLMSAYDWNTTASANATYPAIRAGNFVSAPFSNTPSGLMTEWYVTSPFFCSEKKVVFTNTVTPLKSARMCLDELEYRNSSLVYSGCSGPFSFSSLHGPYYQSYSFWGQTEYSTPFQFVTS